MQQGQKAYMREEAGAESLQITKEKGKTWIGHSPFSQPNVKGRVVFLTAVMAVSNFTFQILERSQGRGKAPEFSWARV